MADGIEQVVARVERALQAVDNAAQWGTYFPDDSPLASESGEILGACWGQGDHACEPTPAHENVTLGDLRALVSALREARAAHLSLLREVWGQFSDPITRNGWRTDLGLSVLEGVAAELVARGVLERHRTKDWYRTPAALDAAIQGEDGG